MFKVLVLHTLYTLSDDQTEYRKTVCPLWIEGARPPGLRLGSAHPSNPGRHQRRASYLNPQRTYGLTEFQLKDRLSFMRFVGLALSDRAPEAKTNLAQPARPRGGARIKRLNPGGAYPASTGRVATPLPE